jgi:hypothetical protein
MTSLRYLSNGYVPIMLSEENGNHLNRQIMITSLSTLSIYYNNGSLTRLYDQATESNQKVQLRTDGGLNSGDGA